MRRRLRGADGRRCVFGGGCREVEDRCGCLARVLCAIELELSFHLGHLFLVAMEVGFHALLLLLEKLVFLSLAFPRVVGGETVALDALNTTLLLLVVCLGSLAWGQAGLGLRQDLAPRLALLDGLGF